VVDYSGQKDLETLSKFLDDGGVLPEAETLEDEDEFDDDDDEVCIFKIIYCFISPTVGKLQDDSSGCTLEH